MIKIRTVTMKNFLSVGATTQAVQLDQHGLTLILGENVDQGSNGSRNGVGKTTLIQAICYAIYGKPLTAIRQDNLINKINQKGMVVSLDFDIGLQSYRIERGRKPNFLRFYVNDGLVTQDGDNEAHGESKITQEEIEKVIGASHMLFRQAIALHSKTTPFLDMNAKDQREVIEELLGISQLSTKAEQLKNLIKDVKDAVRGEDIRIKTVIDSNNKIQNTINDLKFKSKIWDQEHAKKLEKLQKAIDQLKEIDIEAEINNQRVLVEFGRVSQEVMRFERDAGRMERVYNGFENNIQTIGRQLATAEQQKCHTCGQDVHADKHAEILAELQARKLQIEAEREQAQNDLFAVATELEKSINELTELGEMPAVSYGTMEQALNHRHTLDKLESDYRREAAVDSPYIDQIANLSTSGIQEVTRDFINELTRLQQHQEFLLKLLTDKSSFIRKKIIDQNLSYLNVRLNSYLDKLKLPHEVAFQNDLTVQITRLGREYDFAQLSNGEANRVVLGLAWAFRDVWETMNRPLNLLMIDELVDSGMDADGMDLALEILKKNARERSKNIFLISHKDELTARVPRVLLVQYENNFTTFVTDTEQND